MRTRIAVIAAGLVISGTLSGCTVPSALDVVGRDSLRAFGDVLTVLPAERSGPEDTGGWRIQAPDGGAWFEWDNQVVALTVDARPFIEAGLDIALLENVNEADNTLVYLSPGFNMLNADIQRSPLAQFEKDALFLRDDLGYHLELDHYNITVGDGVMFEWAKDMALNEATGEPQQLDIVFALNPEPLIAAGVDPAKLEGWKLAPVEMMGEVNDKFLKTFDLI